MEGDFSKLLVLRIMIMDVTYEIMRKVKRERTLYCYGFGSFQKKIKIEQFITKNWLFEILNFWCSIEFIKLDELHSIKWCLNNNTWDYFNSHTILSPCLLANITFCVVKIRQRNLFTASPLDSFTMCTEIFTAVVALVVRCLTGYPFKVFIQPWRFTPHSQII